MASKKPLISGIALLFALGGLYIALSRRDPKTDPLDQAASGAGSVIDRILNFGSPDTKTDEALDGNTNNNSMLPLVDTNSDTNPTYPDGSSASTTCGTGTVRNAAGLCVPDPNYKPANSAGVIVNPTTTPNPQTPTNTPNPRPFGNTSNIYNFLANELGKGNTGVIPSGFGGTTRTVTKNTNTAAQQKQIKADQIKRSNNNFVPGSASRIVDFITNGRTKPTTTTSNPPPMNTKRPNPRSGCFNCNATSNGKPVLITPASQRILNAYNNFKRGS